MLGCMASTEHAPERAPSRATRRQIIGGHLVIPGRQFLSSTSRPWLPRLVPGTVLTINLMAAVSASASGSKLGRGQAFSTSSRRERNRAASPQQWPIHGQAGMRLSARRPIVAGCPRRSITPSSWRRACFDLTRRAAVKTWKGSKGNLDVAQVSSSGCGMGGNRDLGFHRMAACRPVRNAGMGDAGAPPAPAPVTNPASATAPTRRQLRHHSGWPHGA